MPRKYRAKYTKEQFLDEMVLDVTGTPPPADNIIVDSDDKKIDELVDERINRVRRNRGSDTGALASSGDDERKPKKKVKMEAAIDQRLAEMKSSSSSLPDDFLKAIAKKI